MTIAAALLISCKPSTEDPDAGTNSDTNTEQTTDKTDAGNTDDKKDDATGDAAGEKTPEVIELTGSVASWAGTLSADGVLTFTSPDANYGTLDFKDVKAKQGDKITLKFEGVPTKLRLYWVEDPYEEEKFDWGTGVKADYCHYSADFSSEDFEYTFEKDAAIIALQANNDQNATCKLVKATLTKAE